jgi:hypothetical protein
LTMRMRMAIVFLEISFLFLSCASYNISGGSTETTNAVAGRLYLCDGRTPAKGVRVAIRPRNMLPDIFRIGLAKRSADTASVTSDDSGVFIFDSPLDTGMYMVEGKTGTLAVLIDSVPVKPVIKDSTVRLPPETLQPVGAISGFVKVANSGDSSNLFVLAVGIDRYERVNADGSFTITTLAEADYSLKVVSNKKNYEVVSTISVSVKPAITTKLDTIMVVDTLHGTPEIAITVSMLKINNGDLPDWRMSQNVDSFTVWNSVNLYDYIDGGASVYADKGMVEAAGLKMVGPVGEYGDTAYLNKYSFIMDFGNDSNAVAIYNYQRTIFFNDDSLITIPGYDKTIAFGVARIGGTTVYAHFKNIYFELNFTGIANPLRTDAIAILFLNFFKGKIE